VGGGGGAVARIDTHEMHLYVGAAKATLRSRVDDGLNPCGLSLSTTTPA
jgi:hypothetical protein